MKKQIIALLLIAAFISAGLCLTVSAVGIKEVYDAELNGFKAVYDAQTEKIEFKVGYNNGKMIDAVIKLEKNKTSPEFLIGLIVYGNVSDPSDVIGSGTRVALVPQRGAGLYKIENLPFFEGEISLAKDEYDKYDNLYLVILGSDLPGTTRKSFKSLSTKITLKTDKEESSETTSETTSEVTSEPSSETTSEESSETTSEPPVTIKTGDVNDDGDIDSMDASKILQADAGLIELNAAQKTAADVNGDGDIDAMDASLILQLDAGLISSFAE